MDTFKQQATDFPIKSSQNKDKADNLFLYVGIHLLILIKKYTIYINYNRNTGRI